MSPDNILTENQVVILSALTERMTIKQVHAKLDDEQLDYPKVRMQMVLLMHKGLTDNRNRVWYRTAAGERVVQKKGEVPS